MIYIPNPNAPLINIRLLFYRSRFTFPQCKPGVIELALKQLTQGSLTYPRAQFQHTLESLGSTMKTVYTHKALGLGGVMLADYVEEVLDLWHDVITQPLLSEENFNNTQRIYAHELQNQYEDDEFLSYTWLLRILHRSHILWPSISLTPRLIQNVTLQDVKQIWPSLFSQQDFFPSICGDVTLEQAQNLFSSFASKLSVEAAPIASELQVSPYDEYPNQLSSTFPKLWIIHRPAKQQVHIYMGQQSIKANHPDALALSLAIQALGGTFTSPLMQELRVKRGLTYSCYAYMNFTVYGSMIYIQATVDAEDCAEALEIIRDQYHRAQTGQLTDQEITFAKEYCIHAYPLKIETPSDYMYELIKSHLLDKSLNDTLKYSKMISEIHNDTIRMAAQQHFQSTPTIMLMGDQTTIESTIKIPSSYLIQKKDALDDLNSTMI